MPVSHCYLYKPLLHLRSLLMPQKMCSIFTSSVRFCGINSIHTLVQHSLKVRGRKGFLIKSRLRYLDHSLVVREVYASLFNTVSPRGVADSAIVLQFKIFLQRKIIIFLFILFTSQRNIYI